MRTSADVRDPETHAIIGAGLRVHRELGTGFLEGVYQEAFEVECALQRIPFVRQRSFPLIYRGIPLKSVYRADLVCFGRVIVELKATRTVSALEEAQVINYLKASGFTKGLLLNFGAQSLQFRRLVLKFDDSA